MKIKILSYNIHKGFDWKNKKYQLQDIKRLIIESKADIVCLQEVVGENKKNKAINDFENQLEYFSDNVWKNFSYGKNSIYDHGHHGNLILSKFPIINFDNINITTNFLEKRGMLICKINCVGRDVVVVCLHLNLLHSGRLIQYIKIEEVINSLVKKKSPLIIAGDFNDWNKKSSIYFESKMGMHETFKKIHGDYAKTFPVQLPLLSLDRIYVRNLKILNASTIKASHLPVLSDHLPVLSEVEIYEK